MVASSNHYAGFIGQYNFASTDQGITPAFNWDQGLPSYPLPPQINPAFANNQNVDWWQGQDATRAPETHLLDVSIQRQLSPSTVLEATTTAPRGRICRPGLVNINQVPMSVVNAAGESVRQHAGNEYSASRSITDPMRGGGGHSGAVCEFH